MKANPLRLWFSSLAYVSIEAPQRLGLAHTEIANARPRQYPPQAAQDRRPAQRLGPADQNRHRFGLPVPERIRPRPRAAPARSRGASVPASRALKANARPLRLVMRENKGASPPWREQQHRWRRHASPLSRGRNKTCLQSRPPAASAEKCGLGMHSRSSFGRRYVSTQTDAVIKAS